MVCKYTRATLDLSTPIYKFKNTDLKKNDNKDYKWISIWIFLFQLSDSLFISSVPLLLSILIPDITKKLEIVINELVAIIRGI